MLRSNAVGEDTVTNNRTRGSSATDQDNDDLYARAEAAGTDGAARDDHGDDDEEEVPTEAEFLQLVREAESQAQLYINQVNRKSWARSYKAFHNEHFAGSKYQSDDFRNRSKLFVPKTRAAVRKDLAAVAASLFGTMDAITCSPGNEADKQQAGSAAVVQELLNYRTNRASGKAALPWFYTALGARQTAVLTGICISKQSWKLEMRKTGHEEVGDDKTGQKAKREVWKPFIDRPDSQLIPPENFTIDPAADWTNPCQDAAYIILKWPMRLDEIRAKQKDPRNPWRNLTESQLRGAGEGVKFDMAAIRRAREQGIDRMDEANNSQSFDVIWVYETFMRCAGEDWTFLSVGDKCLLTDPKPVREVYPEQFGERPLTWGIGSFEAFRLFPMSSAESWQMLQMEVNDLRNLTLDAVKQNVLPVTKVVRGRQVDLDALKRRGQGSSIMVTNKDDVTWDRPPDVPGSTMAMKQSLDIEFDDIAGQQNYSTVDANNNLSKTLGGLKLAAGAANAVQEFDIRIWIESWCEPTLAQLVRLIQYYESDPIVLGLCGDKAQLLEKHGINQITNELLENEVTLRVNIGLGNGDPSQRLAKFSDATNIALPLLQQTKEFQSGEYSLDIEGVMDEVYGAAGYKDGGKRFIKKGQPSQNPMAQPQMDKLKSETEKNKAAAKALVLNALANAAKVGLGQRELEDAFVNSQFQNSLAHMDQLGKARDLGHKHGEATHKLANPERQPQMGPDGQPMPDTGGGAPADGGGPADLIGGPSDVGAGNDGVNPNDVLKHGVPAGDAGHQQQQDAAAEPAKLEAATKPKTRKVTIAKRGPDGRASEFHISE
jgi:hypothetical protein